MSRAARLKRNIVTNWLGFVVSAAITLLLTPIVIRELGTTRYGIWVLTSSIVGYYGILDLGSRAGLTQYLTRHLAIGDHSAAAEYVSSAVAAFGALACALGGLTLVAALASPAIFNVPSGLAEEAFWCILVIGVGSAVQFALFPFAAIFPAAERFDVANYIGISTRLVSALFVVLSLRLDHGLVGVSVASSAANIIDYTLRWKISGIMVPGLGFSRSRVRLSRLREILSFGIWNFLTSVNGYAYLHAPNIIIATFLRLPAVGQYALAMGMMQQISSFLKPVGHVLYPAAAALHARNDRDGLKRLYHGGSRLMMLMMIPAVLIPGFFANDFYRLWIGEEYLSGVPYHSVSLLLQVLLLSTVTSYTTNMGVQILIGSGRIKPVAIALICGSLLSLSIGVVLVQLYALLGIAIAVVIASTIIDLIVVPLMVQRVLNLSVVEWVREACVRPILVCVVDVVLLGALRATGYSENWWQLSIVGIVALGVCACTALTIGVTSEERQRIFVWWPARSSETV